MLKKVSLFLLCGIVLISVCGCGSKQDNDTNSNNTNTSIKTKLSDEYNYIGKFNHDFVCSSLDLDDIIFFSSSRIVTSNKVYKFSTKKLFSTTNENCAEIEIENLDGSIIGYSGGEVETVFTKTSEYIYSSSSKTFRYLAPDATSNIKSVSYYDSLGESTIYYLSYATGDIVSIDNNLKKFKDNVEIDITEDFDDGERVVSINDSLIKTDRAYYTISQYNINQDECKKYEDVKCEVGYKLIKEDTLTKYYNDIAFLDDLNARIIDKDGNVYQYIKKITSI